MEYKIFNHADEFARASADFVITQGGGGAMGLSGGSTPLPVYSALASDPAFDVEEREFFLVDERFVSIDSPDSNYASVVKAFGAAEPFFSDHFHWFDTARTIDEAVARYQEELATLPDAKFSLVILGIGADGHTASLFPNSPGLEEKEKLVSHTINEKAPNPPVRDRLTITWPVILKAKTILVLLSGESKKSVVEELQRGHKIASEFPAKRLLEHSNVVVHWLASAKA